MDSKVEKVWIDDKFVYIQTAAGEVFREAFADYPRLSGATAQQRAAFEYNEVGIRWDALDEDLSFEGFIDKKPSGTTELYRVFKSHPELNASAVARALGIPQSVMAAYIYGIKKPSRERIKLIENKLQTIGKELAAIRF